VVGEKGPFLNARGGCGERVGGERPFASGKGLSEKGEISPFSRKGNGTFPPQSLIFRRGNTHRWQNQKIGKRRPKEIFFLEQEEVLPKRFPSPLCVWGRRNFPTPDKGRGGRTLLSRGTVFPLMRGKKKSLEELGFNWLPLRSLQVFEGREEGSLLAEGRLSLRCFYGKECLPFSGWGESYLPWLAWNRGGRRGFLVQGAPLLFF